MDPLAQLKDIHLPEQIHNYPLALGWWVLVIIIIALLTFIVVKVRKTHVRNRAKKRAIKQLTKQDVDNDTCVIMLKWAALQYFPRVDVANLYGKQFQHFLVNSLPQKHQTTFSTLCGNVLEEIYSANKSSNDFEQTASDFHQATLLWLKQALPPKVKLDLSPNQSTQGEAA